MLSIVVLELALSILVPYGNDSIMFLCDPYNYLLFIKSNNIDIASVIPFS